MDKALTTLEFDRIRERLASFASFAAGRERALSLMPSPHYEEVAVRLRLAAEARRLLEMRPNLSLAEAHDVREAADRAAKGGLLRAEEMLAVRATLACGSSIYSLIRRLEKTLPTLWQGA